MKKSGIMFLFALLLVMPLVVANTEVKIKTVPNAEVQIVIYDADIEEFTLTERYTGNSDEYGDISKDFDISDETFHLKIFVKKDGEPLISNERFLDNPSGELLYLEIPYKNVELIETPGFENGVAIVEEIEEIVNDTINETENLEDENSMAVKTGFSVFGDDGILSKKNFSYFGGFLLLIIIVGFVVASIKHKINASPKEIKIKKLSELQKEKEENLGDKKEDIEDYKKIVENAERKIAEAQEDIKKIKNEGKIKEMKKKIAEDESELVKLRKGED